MKNDYALDSKTHEFLEGFGQVCSSIASLSIPKKRAQLHSLFTIPVSEMEPIAKREDKAIEGPNSKN